MPIRTAAPPEGTYASLASHLASAPTLLSDADQIGAAEPIPVYYIGLDDLAGDRGPDALTALEPRVWRHLLVRNGEAVGEADVVAQAAEARVVAVHQGPRAAGTERSLSMMRSHEFAAEREYELRMLESPGIYLVALWLHAPGNEVLVPTEPDQTGLPLHEPIRLEEALPRLRELANAVREAQDRYPGPSGA